MLIRFFPLYKFPLYKTKLRATWVQKHIRNGVCMCMYFNVENSCIFLLVFLVYLENSTSNIYMALLRAQSSEFFDVFTPGLPSLSTTGIWGTANSLLQGCPVHCRTFTSILGLSACGHSMSPVMNTKNVSRHCQNHSPVRTTHQSSMIKQVVPWHQIVFQH